MSGPVKEILFVGFGAVGAICEFKMSDIREDDDQPSTKLADSLILKRSGFARVTVVARSNYDSVKSTSPNPFIVMILLESWMIRRRCSL